MLRKYFLNFLQLLSPRAAHSVVGFALSFLPTFLCAPKAFESPDLEVKAMGKTFANPIGLAAGFDKNARYIKSLSKVGFGFLEVGTVTPFPQYGNPHPRLFRLPEDKAVINRLGFNNNGADHFMKNLERYSGVVSVPIGANVGKNKDSQDAIADYVLLAKRFSALVSYVTLNVSSPNTAGLRDLQKAELLDNLVSQVQAVVGRDVPLLIKVAPDLSDEGKADIVNLALRKEVTGIIVSNTTTACRKFLISDNRVEYGGLSGKPLFNLSTTMLREMYQLSKGKLLFIGCGGIFDAETAYEKIISGATLLQLYTALTYEGFELLNSIKKGLIEKLRQEGLTNIMEAVGSGI